VDHGLNAETATWVDDEAWWCVLDLPTVAELAPEERSQVVFEGLDTVVDVWLDGEPRGRHRNMFRPLSLDLGPGASRVHLRFEAFTVCPPMVELRKAPFSAGWDFAPARPGVGVWQPVEVRRHRHASLGDVGFRTLRATEGSADVAVDLDVQAWTGAALSCAVRLVAPDGRVTTADAEVVDGHATVPLVVEHPALWWTHDLGEPALHRLEVSLRADGVEVDAVVRDVGLRTVTLDRTDGAFALSLNGVPLAVRGVNWVPCSTALGEIPADAYAPLLDRVVDAHAQLVRVWGGGNYEPAAFYEECDRRGLLVWQDFMFAGAAYSDEDPAFVAEVLAEAHHQVRRLRAHPSVALWCGNNEVELLAGLLAPGPVSPADRLFRTLLAEVVEQESPGTPYVSSSPVANNDPADGDRHTWEAWHGLDNRDPDRTWVAWSLEQPVVDPESPEGKDFAARAGAHRYLEDDCRFVSEYGFAAFPSLETLRSWTDPDELVLGARQVTARQRPGRLGPVNKAELLMAAELGRPRDLADQVVLSQLLQAESLKTGAEHYRRRWPRCGGQVVWQLDDCWPATSWSLIDVEGRPKAGWYAVRRAYAPVLASFRPTATGATLWLTNNAKYDVTDVLDVELRTFDGQVREQWEVPAEVAVGESLALRDVPVDDRHDCYLAVTSRGGHVPPNRQLLAPIKDLSRDAPQVEVALQHEQGVLRATLTSDVLALGVHLLGADLAWDEHFVDVHPGRPVVLTTPLDGALPALVVVAR
jgi:beta-mannosidase